MTENNIDTKKEAEAGEQKLSFLAWSVWQRITDTALMMIVSFLIVWIFSVDDYSRIKVIQSAGGALVVFAHLGLPVAISHIASKSLSNNPERSPTPYLYVSLLGTSMVFAISILFGNSILEFLGIAVYDDLNFFLYILGMFLLWVSEIVLSYISALQDYRNLLLVQFLRTFVQPILIPLCMVLFIFGFCLGTLIVGVVAFVISVVVAGFSTMKRNFKDGVSQERLRESAVELYQYSLQAFLPKVVRQMYIAAPVLLLIFVSSEAPAFFAIAYTIGTLALIFPYAFGFYSIPIFTAFYTEKKLSKLKFWYKEGASFIIIAATSMNLAILLVPEALLNFFPPVYLLSRLHIPLLALGGVLLCLLVFDAQVLHAAGKITPCLLTEIIILCSTLPIIIMLIPIIGALAATVGFVIGVGCGVLVQQFLIHRELAVGLGKGRILGILMITGGVSLIFYIVKFILGALNFPLTPLIQILLAGFVMGFYIILSMVFKVIPSDLLLKPIRRFLSR